MSTSGAAGGRPEPWTPAETVALLDAYEHQSLSSRRGQLRAWQWDEVAAAVAARVGRSPGAGAKTGTQCRHKIEKLRQRYRAERARQLPPHMTPAWPYFSRMESMDHLDRGRPTPSMPPAAPLPPPDSDDESESFPPPIPHKKPKITFTNGGFKFESVPGDSRSPRFFRKPMNEDTAYEDDEDNYHYDDNDDDASDDEEDDSDNDDDDDVVDDLVSAVRGFGQNLMRMEVKKMEMIREMERERMEMEEQRAQMVVNASRRLAEMIENAVGTASSSVKKAKKL